MARTGRFVRMDFDSKDPEIARALDFATHAYPGQPPINAFRELLIAGLGTDPLAPAVTAGRRAAYTSASLMVRTRLAAALRDTASTLELEAVAARAQIVDEQTKPCEICGHVKCGGER